MELPDLAQPSNYDASKCYSSGSGGSPLPPTQFDLFSEFFTGEDRYLNILDDYLDCSSYASLDCSLYGPLDCHPDDLLDCYPDASLDCYPDASLDCYPDASLDCYPDASLDCYPDAPLDCYPDAPLGCYSADLDHNLGDVEAVHLGYPEYLLDPNPIPSCFIDEGDEEEEPWAAGHPVSFNDSPGVSVDPTLRVCIVHSVRSKSVQFPAAVGFADSTLLVPST